MNTTYTVKHIHKGPTLFVNVDAWMNANDNRNGRNACVIDSSRNFHYFKKSFWKIYSRKIIPKGDLNP